MSWSRSGGACGRMGADPTVLGLATESLWYKAACIQRGAVVRRLVTGTLEDDKGIISESELRWELKPDEVLLKRL